MESVLSSATIVLVGINARYIHSSFGLKYLQANLGFWRPHSAVREYDLTVRPLEVAEEILSYAPKIVGFGVYIWNRRQVEEIIGVLKSICPDTKIILGGPEVSFETGRQPIVQWADYVLTGEADLAFGRVCSQILEGNPPSEKIIHAPPPDLDALQLPYDLYCENDLHQRLVYVEASRGCPMGCEFCLSSVEGPLRQFPLEPLLREFDKLWQRGLRHFKFADRSFNLNGASGRRLLEFFLARCQPGMLLHFEVMADRLDDSFGKILARFPPGTVQLEIGIQTLNAEVSERIHRRQNLERLESKIRFLRQQTGAHLHADLIAGLPGETWHSFAAGFDRLLSWGPHEIQVGLLKRLWGAPIVRHSQTWQMVYNPNPPYELLRNRDLGFAQVQQLRRFARCWDLVVNSGNFQETSQKLIETGPSPFRTFLKWSEWLHTRTGRTHSIALGRLAELLFSYLVRELEVSPVELAPVMLRDYQKGARSDLPPFLRPFLGDITIKVARAARATGAKRQARHWAKPCD